MRRARRFDDLRWGKARDTSPSECGGDPLPLHLRLALSGTLLLVLAGCGDPAGVPQDEGLHSFPSEPLLDLVYCSPSGLDLSLDYYPPASAFPGLRPLVIHFHRGGWISGVKSGPGWVPEVRSSLNDAGYALASVQYRLAPTHRWPAAIEDARCAIRFLRKNASLLGLDPDRFVTWGVSAGAHLAALAAVVDSTAGFDGANQHAEVSSSVSGVVSFWGPMDLTQEHPPAAPVSLLRVVFGSTSPESPVLRQASPLHQVKEDAPPHLLIHGTHDETVPVQQAALYYRRLVDLEVPVEIRIFTPSDALVGSGQPHAPDKELVIRELMGFLTTLW